MRSEDHITNILRVYRHFSTDSIFNCPNANNGVHRCTYTTNTLHDHPSIARIRPFYNILHAAPHCSCRPCVSDDAIFNFTINTQVTFNAGNRINCNTFFICHAFSPLIVLSDKFSSNKVVFLRLSVSSVFSFFTERTGNKRTIKI